MATTVWGTELATDFPVTSTPGEESAPSVADSGGGSYGVAWTSSAGVTVRFYDVVGQVDPGLGTIVLTQDATAANVSLAAGGAVGYAAAWESDTGLKIRYIGLAAPVGGELTVSANGAGTTNHDASTSGYFVDGANGKPIVDGFNVAWISTVVTDSLTAQQIADGYGRIMLQRFAVPLDNRVDPIGPPVASGLDGVVGGDADGAINVAGINQFGRDVAVATDHADNDTLVAWIDTAGAVHARLYTVNGTPITTASGAVTGIASLDNLGTAGAASDLQVISNGAGFVVAWVDAGGIIRSQVFTGGGAASTFAVSSATLMNANNALPAGSAFNGEFALGALLETNGFTLAVGATNGGGQKDLYIQSYNAGGGSDGSVDVVSTAAGNQSGIALGGLIGDRVVAVYQDGPSNDIRSVILDTRAAGVILNGDNGGNGQVTSIADQLVGTVFNDTLSGLSNDDELYGAIGDDRLIGGAGNDLIDGGAGQDVAVFSGSRANYTIDYLGGTLFTVTDNRGGNPDGTDTVRGVEAFRFLGETVGTPDVTAASIITGIVPVTPTAWGWTNADADSAPDSAGSPDVDGFLVNHGSAKTGIQDNVAIADSVGEFIAIAWESTSGIDPKSHIYGQFYDVIGAPDAFIPNTLALSDGVGIESNVAIASGGANSGWGFVFEELDSASDISHALRTNFVGPGQLTSVELAVAGEGTSVDQHDAAIFGSFLDHKLVNGVLYGPNDILPNGDGVLPAGMNEGYNVVWVSTDTTLSSDLIPVNPDGLTAADIDAGYGRIMLQRFEVGLDALGNPGAPVAAGIDGLAGVENVFSATDNATTDALNGDEAVWIGDELATGAGGFIGRNPGTSSLHTFETGIIWIAKDNISEHVMFAAIDDVGQHIGTPSNISGNGAVAAGTNAQIASAGAVNFGIAWITGDGTGPYKVMATMLSSAGNGLDGTGFGFGAPAEPFWVMDLPPGFNPANSNFQLTGISGEDSNDLVISWNMTSAGNGDDVMAQHIKVALDPITGIAVAMGADGDAIRINTEASGNQNGGVIAGLLGDRFIAAWHDTKATYTDGDDIVARIIDTRDAVNPDPITGDLIRNGNAQARRDVLIGTNGNDVIKGDISDSNGLVDYIYAGMGDDVIQGGPGLRGAAGIPEIIDGGEGDDIAVFTGRRQDYSITVNGDGSIEVIDLRPTQDGAGNPLQHDGTDNLYSIETLRFLNLTQADPNPAVPPAPTDVVIDLPGTPPAPPAGYDGTPVAWSLDDTSTYKEIVVDVDPTPADAADAKTGINVVNLQDGAALAWISANSEVWAVSYDPTGKPDPILLGANTQLTDGDFAGNMVADIDLAMTGGLGVTAVWESLDGTDSAIHLAFASTNTHVVIDPAGGVPGPGLPGGEMVVVGSDGAGKAVDPVIQGYEVVDVNNDTLEVGFHVGFVLQDDGALGNLDTADGDAYGALMLARYEIPVYDILVDAAGLPILDGAGQGQLATDSFGNLVPSTTQTFGTGSETAPISIGLDGLRGTADDGAAIAVTDQGLFASDAIPVGASVVQGRDLSIGSLHDGQLVIAYIGTDEQMHLKVFIPSVDEAGDRETNAGLDADGNPTVDIVAQGITAYSEFALPFATTLGAVAPGQTGFVVPQQNGSFGVFWADANGGSIDIKGIIYAGAGTNWSPSPLITFANGLPAGVSFQVAPTGVTPGGLEDGFFVTWESGSGILGQRFDMSGTAVGTQIVVGDPTSGTPGLHSTAGIDNGLMLVGYEDSNGSVSAQFLDTREPGVAIIGPRTGAPRDVLVGTVGDDALDGRALGDELHGGLGNDLLTMGSGADIGFGEAGNDIIIGGTGQDQLLGGDGDDLLWGGLSGPADPQVDRDLVDGLTVDGRVSAALIATNPGADIISGGDGTDTISFQGEFGRFNINLSTGVVLSDRAESGTFVLEDVIGQIEDDGAGGTIFNFIPDIENATGGIGDDTLIGNAGDNVIDGGLGNNLIDGLGGNDTAIIHGAFDEYTIAYDDATKTFTFVDADHTEIVRNVETFVFEGGITKTLSQLRPGPVARPDFANVNEDGSVVVNVLSNDQNASGVLITAINGTSITQGGSVTVLNGTVTLLAVSSSGAPQLAFTPGANYFGPASFDYTIQNVDGHVSTSTVSVTVSNTQDAPTDILFNGSPTANSVTINENAANGTVVATLTTLDPDNTAVATNDTFTYSLANNFGGRFQIVGNEVRVLNGALLDYESGPTSFALNVTTNDGKGGAISENFTVNLANINEAPTNAKFQGGATTASFSEAAPNDFRIGPKLTAADPEGGVVRFSLADDAGGRFKIVKDATTGDYYLAVAENLLIDHRGNDTGTSYSVQVQAKDAAGNVSASQTITLTATGVAENRVAGGNGNANTLSGTASNDYINGGANKDTMTGLAGNDVYLVDDSGDKVVEANNGGTDTIYTTLSKFDMGSASNVENLVFTGTGSFDGKLANLAGTLVGGTAGDKLSGGSAADLIEGLGGNDTISGGGGNDRIVGGAGNDLITGGAGSDTLVFRPGFGDDVVTDFTRGSDVIDFSSGIFATYTEMVDAHAISQVGLDVVITVGEDSIILQRVTGWAPGDFHFV